MADNNKSSGSGFWKWLGATYILTKIFSGNKKEMSKKEEEERERKLQENYEFFASHPTLTNWLFAFVIIFTVVGGIYIAVHIL